MRKMIDRRIHWTILTVLLGLSLMVGARLYSKENGVGGEDRAYDHIARFTEAIEQVRANYVDEDKVHYRDLIRGALDGMLSSLDPHSQFLDAEMYKEMQSDTEGHFGGLGIVISIRDNVLTIVAPMEDTPGFEAGLLPGDRIIEIDGESTEGLALSDAVKKLRGKPGTSVKLKILSESEPPVREVDITRAIIEVPSVKDARMLDDHIGYVRIIQFSKPTAEKLEEEVRKLRDQGMTGLIIDLRNNPGGLLGEAIEVTQLFLKRGKVIVSTRGRDPRHKQTYRAHGGTRFLDFPIVLLVNGGSASAAEIFTGALQDYRRAIVVGEKTFGKASVQTILPLDDGSALRLTTAHYYTPKERMIHGLGLEPDIVVPMDAPTWRKLLLQRSRPKHVPPPEHGEDPGEVTDTQLERAMDVLKGVMIFQARNNTHPARRQYAGE